MVHPDYLSAIKRIASQLPAIPFGCFETWLSAEEPRVDFNVLVRGKTNEYSRLMDKVKTSEQPSGLAIHDKTVELSQRWSNPSFPLRSLINGFWLIYDIHDPKSDSPWLWHYPELAKTNLDSDPGLKVEIPMQILNSGGWELNDEIVSQTERFIQDLPKSIRVHCIGANFRNSEPCVRFSLTVPSLAELKTFFTQHEWPGDFSEFESLIEPIAKHIEYYGLGIDISEGLLPTVGIKVYVGNSHERDRIERIAEYLTEIGLCSESKKRALINWPGETKPSSPQMESIKRMAYLKFVLKPGQDCFVKAYNCYFTIA